MDNKQQKHKKTLTGVVASTKMNKTIVVRVDARIKHPLYGKTINKSKNFKAHDEKNECKEGDTVSIIECRPLSKDKKFRLLSIIKTSVVLEADDLDKGVNEVLKKEEAKGE